MVYIGWTIKHTWLGHERNCKHIKNTPSSHGHFARNTIPTLSQGACKLSQHGSPGFRALFICGGIHITSMHISSADAGVHVSLEYLYYHYYSQMRSIKIEKHSDRQDV